VAPPSKTESGRVIFRYDEVVGTRRFEVAVRHVASIQEHCDKGRPRACGTSREYVVLVRAKIVHSEADPWYSEGGFCGVV
jgi:hypothetical protein